MAIRNETSSKTDAETCLFQKKPQDAPYYLTPALKQILWNDFSITVDGYDPLKEEPTAFQYIKKEEEALCGPTIEWAWGWNPSVASWVLWPKRTFPNYIGDKLSATAWVDPSYNPEIFDKCYYKFWDKVNDTTLNLAQDLLEGHQTTRMVRQTVRFMTTFRKSFKNLRLEANLNPHNLISGKYLEYIYGVVPTLQTLHGLATYEARNLVSFRYIRSRTSTAQNTSTDTSWYYNTKMDCTQTKRLEIGGRLRIPPSDDLNRLTSLDPARIAYETLPYSFVVDWFVDVGGYLASLEARRRYMSYIDHYYTTTTRLDVTNGTLDRDAPGVFGNGYEYHLKGKSQLKTLIRTPGMPPKIPTPRTRLPSLGYHRIGAAAALLYQGLFGH
jgi:hypothetical protein